MPKVSQIKYDLKELTALMLRDQGIRSGLWMLWTKWTFGATNVAPPEDQPGGAVGPGAITVLTEVGIQAVEEPGPLSVDASEVWTGKKPAARGKARARADNPAKP
jgi:hypothetical protein